MGPPAVWSEEAPSSPSRVRVRALDHLARTLWLGCKAAADVTTANHAALPTKHTRGLGLPKPTPHGASHILCRPQPLQATRTFQHKHSQSLSHGGQSLTQLPYISAHHAFLIGFPP